MWLRLLNLVGLDGLNCVRVFDSNIAEMKAYDCNVLAPRKRFLERFLMNEIASILVIFVTPPG